jgi:Acetyltransferase (GNAT) domain
MPRRRAWFACGGDWSDGTHATWHAVDRLTHRLVASCSIFAIDRDHATAKIGYRVAPWQRRRGIGSEVAGIVTRWDFAELGLARVQLEHAVANAALALVAVRTQAVMPATATRSGGDFTRTCPAGQQTITSASMRARPMQGFVR